jgi:hypothetical protein
MPSQENFKLVSVVAMLSIAGGAEAASIVHSAPPDPVLSGPPPGPCAAAAAGPDYVDGIDASGHPVVRAAAPHVLAGVALVTLPQQKRRYDDVTLGIDLEILASVPCVPQRRR